MKRERERERGRKSEREDRESEQMVHNMRKEANKEKKEKNMK